MLKPPYITQTYFLSTFVCFFPSSSSRHRHRCRLHTCEIHAHFCICVSGNGKCEYIESYKIRLIVRMGEIEAEKRWVFGVSQWIWLECVGFFVCVCLCVWMPQLLVKELKWPWCSKYKNILIAVVATIAIGLVKTTRHLQVENWKKRKENETGYLLVSHMANATNLKHLTEYVCRNA